MARHIRQLKHMVHGLACQHPDQPCELGPQDVDLIADWNSRNELATRPTPALSTTDLFELPFNDAKQIAVSDFESGYIVSMLRTTCGNITRAANLAGKNRRAFFELMRKNGICATISRTPKRS